MSLAVRSVAFAVSSPTQKDHEGDTSGGPNLVRSEKDLYTGKLCLYITTALIVLLRVLLLVYALDFKVVLYLLEVHGLNKRYLGIVWFLYTFVNSIIYEAIRKMYLKDTNSLIYYTKFSLISAILLQILNYFLLETRFIPLLGLSQSLRLATLAKDRIFVYVVMIAAGYVRFSVFFTISLCLSRTYQSLLSRVGVVYSQVVGENPYNFKNEIDSKKGLLESLVRFFTLGYVLLVRPYGLYSFCMAFPQSLTFSFLTRLVILLSTYFTISYVFSVAKELNLLTLELSKHNYFMDLWYSLKTIVLGLRSLVYLVFAKVSSKESLDPKEVDRHRNYNLLFSFIVLSYIHAIYYTLVLLSLEKLEMVGAMKSRASTQDQIYPRIKDYFRLILVGLVTNLVLRAVDFLVEKYAKDLKATRHKISIVLTFVVPIAVGIVHLLYFQSSLSYVTVLLLFDYFNNTFRLNYYKTLIRHPVSNQTKDVFLGLDTLVDFTGDTLFYLLQGHTAKFYLDLGSGILIIWMLLLTNFVMRTYNYFVSTSVPSLSLDT